MPANCRGNRPSHPDQRHDDQRKEDGQDHGVEKRRPRAAHVLVEAGGFRSDVRALNVRELGFQVRVHLRDLVLMGDQRLFGRLLLLRREADLVHDGLEKLRHAATEYLIQNSRHDENRCWVLGARCWGSPAPSPQHLEPRTCFSAPMPPS